MDSRIIMIISNQNNGRFKVLIPYFLQAIVIVGFPVHVRLVEGLVGVHTVHGGFDSRVLKHALSPLLQLRCAVKAAEKTKGIKSFS